MSGEDSSRKKRKCGIGCFCCNETEKRNGNNWLCCKNSEGKSSRKGGKCGLGCFCCKKTQAAEDSVRERGKCGLGCFCCKKTQAAEDSVREGGKCGLGCFCCKKTKTQAAEDSVREGGKSGSGCFCCKKTQAAEDSAREGGKCGSGCFCCKKKQAAEDSTRERGKCGLGCFCCKKTQATENAASKRGKCGLGCLCCKKTQATEDPVRQKEKRRVRFLSCNDRSKEEESTAKGGRRGGCCFFCKGSSKVEDPSAKRRKCGMNCLCCKRSKSTCCFRCDKSSSEEATRRKGWCSCCFFRNKSSEEQVLGGGGHQKAKVCFHCCKSSSSKETTRRKGWCSCYFCCNKSSNEELSGGQQKAKGCFYCCKSTQNEETMTCCRKRQPKESDPSSKRRCARVMSCFSCCSLCAKTNKKKKNKKICWRKRKPKNHLASLIKRISFKSDGEKHRSAATEILRIGNGDTAAQVFKLRELEAATQNFSNECLLGQGGFGRVYKGQLRGTDQRVAVKQLDREGYQGNREFLIEVLMLSLLNHHNLVTLLGYCVDRDERILVYDYMSLGSVEDHLHGLSPNSTPLDWKTRMKIAAGAARGLEYLHDIANPPVIYRDLKTSNILLDEDYTPKLSDFGLAKLGPVGDQKHVSTRVMGTYGYCAPEYALTGKLTKMSDVYCFGIVLLELITGRKPMDKRRPSKDQLLVEWAAPLINDKKRFIEVADPFLKGNFPVKSLYQALAIVTMCLQENASARPAIRDIVTAIEFLARSNCNISPVESGGSTGTLLSAESEIERCISGINDEGSWPRAIFSAELDIERPNSGINDRDRLRQQSGCDWRNCSETSEDKNELDIDMG